MTLRLTDDEQTALRERAEAEGISMQEAARRPCASSSHAAPTEIASLRRPTVSSRAHREALDRLGE